MSDTHDEFTEAMWQHMQKVNALANEKIRALRDEIKDLRAELKDRDPQLWEMAEEICALQLRVLSLTPCKHGMDERHCGLCDDERIAAVGGGTNAR